MTMGPKSNLANERLLPLWVLYDHPKDYPDKFVARRFDLDNPTGDLKFAETLDELRDALPPGLTCLGRMPEDDPVIVEVWL